MSWILAFLGFAFVHPKRDAGRIYAMIEHAVTRWRFRGMKVHGHEAIPTREVCETARAFRAPLIVDVAGKAAVIEMLAPQYPDVNFIVPHLGSYADDWRAHQQVIDQLVRFPNVYADTSSVRRFGMWQATQPVAAGCVPFETSRSKAAAWHWRQTAE